MRFREILVLLLSLFGAASLVAQAPVEVAVITTHPEIYREALEAFTQRYGPGRLSLILADHDVDCQALSRARAVFVEGGYWSPGMAACTNTVREMEKRGAAFTCTMPQLVQANWRVPASPRLADAPRYHNEGGAENMIGFLAVMHNGAGGRPAIQPPALKESAATGIYHPSAEKPFPSLTDYLAWYRSSFPERADQPRVGLMFFRSFIARGETATVDALIAALERRGLVPVPAFGWPLASVEPLLTMDSRAAIDTLLLVDPVMPSTENARFLEKYQLHAMNLMTTSATEAEWRSGESGLPPGRLPIQVGNAERSGVSEPILIAASAPKAEGGKLRPIPGQIQLAAARADRWVNLRRLPNERKRLALIYYNNPPGKATLGASYLDLIPSLRNVVERLRQEGYVTGGDLPNEEQLKRLLLLSGRNVGEYAPGELEALVQSGHASLLSMALYNEWFHNLPEAFQKEVTAVWGSAGKSRLMTVERDGQRYFVMPGIRLGNLLLAPQPLRGDIAKADASTHDRNTPPPHSYIAAYLYYRNYWRADALVHFGRHGTLEWLPGKDVAQQESDPGSALVGDLPHAYYYLVDGGGEFLQAKRRSNATVISHLTPMLASSGTPKDYQELRNSIENFRATADSAPEVANEHALRAWREARRLKLDTRLELAETQPAAERMERLREYIHDLEEQAIPLGLHRIGGMPTETALREALTAFLQNAATAQTKETFSANAAVWAEQLIAGSVPATDCEPCREALTEAREWFLNLRKSPEAELQALVDVLRARHIPSRVSGDPLRSPGALSTGHNMHDQDPRGFPSKASWAAGQRLANELIAEYKRKHRGIPKKVSFVLWYGESGRTQGLQEAQALALLGVRPVWNGRGQVADVDLIPGSELGRPRVDVVLTMSGLFRDGMPEKLELLDKAVRLVREAPEDNVVQSNTVAAEQELLASGVAPEKARQAARARIFGPQPGVFGVGMSGMMVASQDDGDPAAPANLYLRNMNYAYSGELRGEAIRGALKQQLKQNQIVIHGRSSNLYGAIDSDETYQFAGGLNAATTLASGKAPEYLIANARKSGGERYEEAGRFLSRELATRLWNEKWIEAMKASGYAGAQHISMEIEHLYGFRATAPEQVDAEVWQQTMDIYIHDKHNLGLEKWFKEANPHARQMVAARLMEIDRQGVYQFSTEDRRHLVRAYLESVNASGVSCYANACANRKLIQHVAITARELNAVSATELRRYEKTVFDATSPAAADLEIRSDGSPPAKHRPLGKPPSFPDSIQGMKIFEIPLANIRVRTPETPLGWAALLMPLPFGILLGVSRRRYSRGQSTALRLESRDWKL
ncbi:MAG: cobaltochelatase subunit CobN [Bryobacterales bacterium]|nr:cobaltochelatase subunit CobN [Bryobacterales bacterium]